MRTETAELVHLQKPHSPHWAEVQLLYLKQNTVLNQKANPDSTTSSSWSIIENCHVKVLHDLSQGPNSPGVRFLWLQWSCAGNHLSCTWPSAIIYARLCCVSSLDKCQHCRALKNKEKTFFNNHNKTRNTDSQTAARQINKNLQLCCVKTLSRSFSCILKKNLLS